MNLGKTLYTSRCLCVIQSLYRACKRELEALIGSSIITARMRTKQFVAVALMLLLPGFYLHFKSWLHYCPQVRQYYRLSLIEIQPRWRDKQSFVSSEQGCYTWRQRYRRLCSRPGINPGDFCWWDTFWCTFWHHQNNHFLRRTNRCVASREENCKLSRK